MNIQLGGGHPSAGLQQEHQPQQAVGVRHGEDYRVHLDLAAPAAGSPDRAEQIDAFVQRLTALGAHRLRAVKEDDGYFVVMADPEGNEFCVD